MPKKKIKCIQCNKEYFAYHKTSKYCSRNCYLEYIRANLKKRNRRSTTVKIICLNCGKEFVPFSEFEKIAKYCSYKCMGEYRKRMRKNPEKKKCKVCGIEFIPWRSTAKYCSHKCAGVGITELKRNRGYIMQAWEPRKAAGKNNHLDNLWRFAIYERAKYKCEFCGKEEQLNAHHIFSKSNFAVRWDLDNGICLCVSHHIFGNLSFHKAPAEMIEWIKQNRGIEWYNRLLEKSRKIVKTREVREQAYEELKDYPYDKKTKVRMGIR